LKTSLNSYPRGDKKAFDRIIAEASTAMTSSKGEKREGLTMVMVGASMAKPGEPFGSSPFRFVN
jgi:hypothetical protein